MHELVPSAEFRSGEAALKRVMRDATAVDGAVAFVTTAGVDILRRLKREAPTVNAMRVVVRGAPISQPDAVVQLADLGVEVRVVMGAEAERFHPKLWIGRGNHEARVLAGSGNLTPGGLRRNHEQFELLGVGLDGSALRAQLDRWQAFWDLGTPLALALRSPAWREWERQLAERRRLDDGRKRLDRRLARKQAQVGPDGDLSWLREVLGDAVGRNYVAARSRRTWGRKVEVDLGESRGLRLVFLFPRDGHPTAGTRSEVVLEIYPGDTLEQARRLYPNLDAAARRRIVRLGQRDRWSLRSNFHMGVMSRGLVHDHEPVGDVEAYLSYWHANIGSSRQRPTSEWPSVLRDLVRRGIVSQGYPEQFRTGIGGYQQAAPRPGLKVSYAWPREEAERLNRRGELVPSIRAELDRFFSAFGEEPLPKTTRRRRR